MLEKGQQLPRLSVDKLEPSLTPSAEILPSNGVTRKLIIWVISAITIPFFASLATVVMGCIMIHSKEPLLICQHPNWLKFLDVLGAFGFSQTWSTQLILITQLFRDLGYSESQALLVNIPGVDARYLQPREWNHPVVFEVCVRVLGFVCCMFPERELQYWELSPALKSYSCGQRG